jgi:hypothetical protein
VPFSSSVVDDEWPKLSRLTVDEPEEGLVEEVLRARQVAQLLILALTLTEHLAPPPYKILEASLKSAQSLQICPRSLVTRIWITKRHDA